jgi:hypothetical protein
VRLGPALRDAGHPRDAGHTGDAQTLRVGKGDGDGAPASGFSSREEE